MLAARGEIIYTCDLEFSDRELLSQAMVLLNKNSGQIIINGSKTHPNKKDQRGYWRKFLTQINHKLIKILFSSKFEDPNGLKVFKNSALAKKIISECSAFKYLFEAEFLLACQKQGWKIVELPVTIKETRKGNISTFKRIPRVIAELILLRKKLRQTNASFPKP